MVIHACQNPTEFGPRLPLRCRVLRLWFKLMGAVLFRITVVGSVPAPDRNYVVVANHLSWIDHLLLWTILPPEPRLYLLGAAQAISSDFKAWMARTFGGAITFPRGAQWVGKDSLQGPLRVLTSGASLLLFPEGDTGPREGELMPLVRGVGHIMLRAPADCAIVPIGLSGVRDLYWRKAMTVTIGQPFQVCTDGLTHRAAVEAVVRRVRAELAAVLPAYDEPVVAHKPLHFLTSLTDHL